MMFFGGSKARSKLGVCIGNGGGEGGGVAEFDVTFGLNKLPR